MTPINCESCGEKRDDKEAVEITGRVYYLCDDCCRKLVGVIEGGLL
jgi:ribosome-binding protein aMBF1 (putative translation factor)